MTSICRSPISPSTAGETRESDLSHGLRLNRTWQLLKLTLQWPDGARATALDGEMAQFHISNLGRVSRTLELESEPSQLNGAGVQLSQGVPRQPRHGMRRLRRRRWAHRPSANRSPCGVRIHPAVKAARLSVTWHGSGPKHVAQSLRETDELPAVHVDGNATNGSSKVLVK